MVPAAETTVIDLDADESQSAKGTIPQDFSTPDGLISPRTS